MLPHENKFNDHNFDKYINTLATRVFNARLALANLTAKTDFDTRLQILSKRITSNKAKHLLVENELMKFKKIDAAYFRGKEYFGTDGLQNLLVFQPMFKYLKRISRSL